MHFWIDKRSQTCGGLSGRHRVPSSISAGIGRRSGLCSSSRNYYTQAHIKLMVTPVHRFQSVECVAAQSARHHPRTGAHPRHSSNACHHVPSSYNGSHHGNGSSATTAARPNHAHSMELDSGVFLDLPVDASGQRVTDPTHHHHQQQQQQQQQHVLPGGKLKCGMWASFAIVTVFMAGAKFYFNNQSTGMEVLIFCSLLVVVLFAGCTVSLCEAVTSAPQAAVVMEAVQVQPVHSEIESSVQESNEDLAALGLQVANPTQPMIHNQVEPPPPPYHIAVLLPQHRRPPAADDDQRSQIIDDSPPPPYDKAVS